jgi:hypothetical protein
MPQRGRTAIQSVQREHGKGGKQGFAPGAATGAARWKYGIEHKVSGSAQGGNK